jgi:hypothetical protein
MWTCRSRSLQTQDGRHESGPGVERPADAPVPRPFYSWLCLRGTDIIHAMAALAKTNPYIRDPQVRLRSVVEGARQSSILEGARGLPKVGHMCAAIKRSSIAKAKRSAKST